MGRPRFCFPSHIVTSTAAISVGTGTVSTDPDYGFASLYDRSPTVPCWFTDNPITAVDIIFDFAAPQRLDGFAVHAHTFDTSLAVLFQGNATNAWGAPTLSAALSVVAADRSGHSKRPWIDLTAQAGYDVGGFRYWRLHIPVNTRAIKIGEISLIQQWQYFSRDIQFDVVRAMQRPIQTILQTAADVKSMYSHRSKKQGVVGNVLSADADLTNLYDLLDDTFDGTYPFVFILDDAVVSDGAWLVRPTDEMLKSFEVKWAAPDINPSPIQFEELSRVPL